MPELNVDIPVRRVYLREGFMSPVRDSLVPCVVFSATSVPGRALGFQVMTSFGAVVDRLPISALAHDDALLPGVEPAFIPHDVLQLWDCPSRGVVALEHDHLSQLRATVTLKDGHKYQGTYWFTFDWYGSSYADDAGELGHKSGHVFALDCGAFAIQPNSRIRWHEPAFVVDEWPDDLAWDTIDREFRCEQSGRWKTENSSRWDYAVDDAPGAAGEPLLGGSHGNEEEPAAPPEEEAGRAAAGAGQPLRSPEEAAARARAIIAARAALHATRDRGDEAGRGQGRA